jgi:phospholipase C
MDTRRSFLKKTALLSGGVGMGQFLPLSIQNALAIRAAAGSSYLDAEHIVLLMQENRSFDHAFGTLRGVRGFNDPRALVLPSKNKVWLQTDKKGDSYSPFRLDIKDTKITWMGSLPHGRQSQVEARNNGLHDNWLEAKRSDTKGYENMPLTMGYYTREDIPFYYALADAFTVCDQHFCSSLTGTDPNRLYFWSGTVREKQNEDARPYLQNDDVEKGVEWETFPELLEKNNISWKIYQNEIGVEGGFTEEEDVWLGNFGDNVLEYFRQYNVKLSKRYTAYLPKKISELKTDILAIEVDIKSTPDGKGNTDLLKKRKDKQEELDNAIEEQKKYTIEKLESLSAFRKNIHNKAFVTNSNDPFQHELTELKYSDEKIGREINIPKGDVFHQFRQDVENGNLPTVSWLVAPENFSDHPSAPWFGSWYLSEAMDILTKNPEIWKKTIFILTYDENDGYFDHIPPFTAPDPLNPQKGKVSEGIETGIEQARIQEDSPGPIGLGYRVPLVVASPWSRGGWVNSQVFDHTSVLQFLEDFLSGKTGKKIEHENIGSWRRIVCGNLSSVFRPENGEKTNPLPFLEKDIFFETVHKAKFKNLPSNYKNLTKEEIGMFNTNPVSSAFMPQQEKGTRPLCALPYELYADGSLSPDRENFNMIMGAGNGVFKDKSAGAPFNIYTGGKFQGKEMNYFAFAVAPGAYLHNSWFIDDFENRKYHLLLYGPNGFFREFIGNANDPVADIRCGYQHNPKDPTNLSGHIELKILTPQNKQPFNLEIKDNAYKAGPLTKVIDPNNAEVNIIIELNNSFGWYDFSISVPGNDLFKKRYAGHVETGMASTSDPLMGGLI